MPKLANGVETVVIALEDETALTNLQDCFDIVSPPAPKYYILHSIPLEDFIASRPASSERCNAEAVLQKCKRWLKGKYPCSRVEACLVQGRFDEELISLVKRCDADVLIVSHSTKMSAKPRSGSSVSGVPCSVLVLEKGPQTSLATI
ncbi:MAG: hypothetical protein K2W95_34755 [Candidatus Obscuribacterales bacterium]|nr:hypothetical protein [Candidatus Obscuribacterales bacterium]